MHRYTHPTRLSQQLQLFSISPSCLPIFFCRQRHLCYEVFSDKRPKRHPDTARKRERERGFRGVGRGRKKMGWPSLSLPVFLALIWNRSSQCQLSKPQAVRYHPQLQHHRSITLYDWPCSANRGCLNHRRMSWESQWQTNLNYQITAQYGKQEWIMSCFKKTDLLQ